MGSCSLRPKIFDKIRRKWVASTPEEKVRQQWLDKMTLELGYPKELLAVEKDLKELPHLHPSASSLPDRRADILCYAKNVHPVHALYPLLLMECKKEGVSLEEAARQVIGYNHFVNAYFIAVASEENCLTGHYDPETKKCSFLPFMPSYPQLITLVKNAAR